MTSLRLVILSATLLPSLWAEPDTASSLDKRFSINMMDPLTRRSALDKNFVRFGRSGGGINVNREGRGRPDSFVRFGRGEEDEADPEEMISARDSRGKTDFIRFGRGGNNGGSGFIRFGRGKNDNFVRFGRARQDSFVRFGKGFNDYLNPMEDSMNFDRMSRAGNNGYNTNFVRFGKRDPETNEEVINAYKNGLNFDLDSLRKENLARIARFSGKNKQDSFIRFGREPSLYYEDLPKKYSPILKEYGDLDVNRNTDSETDVESPKSSSRTSESSDGYTSYDSTLHGDTRKKRSLSYNDLNTNPSLTTNIPDLSSFYNYPSPLAAAGLPNFIIGPELSVLPTQAKLHNSGKKIEDKNFIRLG